MHKLSTGDLAAVSGACPPSVNNWCRAGLLVPVAGGEGTGDFREFTLMQAVGLAVAMRVQRSERGCALSYVGRLVAAFAALTEEELTKQLSKGQTHLVGIHQPDDAPPSLLLDGARWPDQVDVAAAHEEVRQKVAQIQEQMAHVVPGGRLRGLAGAAHKTLTDRVSK